MNFFIATAAILVFQAKTWFKQTYFQCFANLSSLEESEESVLDNDLFIDINHMKNLIVIYKALCFDVA